MPRTVVDELRYLLEVARDQIPSVRELEQHAARGPGIRTFVERVHAMFMSTCLTAGNQLGIITVLQLPGTM